jgi:hypothetical protein
VVHHGDQQVQQHHDVDHRVRAEHQHAPEAGEALDAGQLKVVQVHQAENGPEECLRRLEQTEKSFIVVIYPEVD